MSLNAEFMGRGKFTKLAFEFRGFGISADAATTNRKQWLHELRVFGIVSRLRFQLHAVKFQVVEHFLLDGVTGIALFALENILFLEV